MALPKLVQLLIPRKSTTETAAIDTDWRTIEIWAKSVVEYVNALPTGGGYASLTGPGETSPTGALTQNGDFTINGLLDVGAGADIEGAGHDITIANSNLASGAISITQASGSGITIHDTSATGTIDIQAGAGAAMNFIASSGTVELGSVSGLTVLSGTSSSLSFFGSPSGGHAQVTVTGSRGGNAALANLLTALSQYNLIQDGTSA